MHNFVMNLRLSFCRMRSARSSVLVRAAALLAGCAALSALALADSVSISQSPLTTPSQVPNNMVLVPSVEWPTVVTHANDPGVAEGSATYAPTTTYAGYFNPNLCYAYHYDATEANRYFYPAATPGTNHSCNGKTGGTSPDPTSQKLWSGNFMNWAAMQAIDTFRLALTGGYRVNRPADGAPPNVTITSSAGSSVSKATSEQSSVTYLEKANSDRLDSSYTPLRRLAANVTDATPSTSSAFHTRIGALRNQLWFIQNTSNTLTSSQLGNTTYSYSDPHAVPLPVPDGSQQAGTDTSVTALPYNPAYPFMSPSADGNVVGAANGTACGSGEPGCSIATYTCPNGGTLSGSTCGAQSVQACTSNSYKYFRTTDKRCHSSNSDGSSSQASASLCSIFGATPPSNGNTGGSCSLASYGATPSTYTHTTYGRNQVWAVSIRVRVCDGTLDTRGDLCTLYSSGYYKPEGLLQRNASNTRYSLFSYLTEDGNTRQGGVMRARQKLIGPVISGEQPYPYGHLPDDTSATGVVASATARVSGVDNPEWDPATGVFINDPDSTDSTATTTSVAAGSGTCTSTDTPDGSSCAIKYSGVINYLNRFGQLGTGLATLKSDDNLSEMYYTALRYLRGLGNVASFSSFSGSKVGNYQNADGLPVIENWYGNGLNAAVTQWGSTRTVGKPKDPMLYQCQTTVVLGIGDTATQAEADAYSSDSSSTSVPGSTFAKIDTTTMTNWRNSMDAGTSTSSARLDTAALAYWAHLNDLRPDIPNTLIPATASDARGQSISTYWVDVVELANLKGTTDNQYYNATKFGGFTIPDSFFASNGGNGNAAKPATTWFGSAPGASNWNTWTSATQTVHALNPSLSNGAYYEPNNMYLGNNGAAMVSSLNAAFTKIAADIAGSGASLAANSTQLGTGTTTYQAVYFTGEWRGDLVAYRVCTGDTSVTGCATQPSGAIATSPAWKASAQLPTPANRKVYTCTGNCLGQSKAVQLTVQGATLSLSPALDTTTANNLCLNPGSCSASEQTAMVNYLLGTDGTLRKRPTTPLGDIVDSQPVYVGQPSANQYGSKSFAAAFASFASDTAIKNRINAIYVAANDGMLHAFFECTLSSSGACASSSYHQGQELYAYLPQAVIRSGLPKLAQSSYGTNANPHQFFNDGELTVMDVQCASTACPNAVGGWATVLIGTTGRGTAKAVYALDVTNPASIQLLWERSAGDGSALDSNSGYIGQMTGKPVIARLSDGSWVALLGNGYNSAQNKPALLQFDIATGKLSVYTTSGSSGDGLAAPAVWIGDSALIDNVSTQAYAGDLNGNVWAFTLATTGGTGTKIFTARTSGNVAQPITAGMIITKNPTDNQVWIFFGTGSVLSTFANDGQTNTWYGLIVQGTIPVSSATTRSNLVQRTIVAENPATSSSLAVRGISAAAAGDMTGKSGWYIDLTSPTQGAQAERMVTPNQFQGSLLLGTSRIPSSSNTDPCNPSGGSGWIMAINPFTGTAASQSFFDANNNNLFTDDLASVTLPDGTVQHYVVAGVGFAATANNPIFVGHDMLISFSNATTGNVNTRGTVSTLQRLSWRELVVQ